MQFLPLIMNMLQNSDGNIDELMRGCPNCPLYDLAKNLNMKP